MTTLETPAPTAGETWNLCLYIYNKTPRSVKALKNLKKLCEEHLAKGYQVEVVDLKEQPHRAVSDQIVAIPTVVRKSSYRTRKVIGDLSDTPRVLAALRQ